MQSFFKLKENNTTVRREVVAGITTFVSMAYIFFLNPQILGQTGMPALAVFVAAIIVAVFGTLAMGLYANVPFALAPGIGMQAYFTYTIVFGFGFKWQQALAIVFLVGILDVIITLTHGRQAIVKAIPTELKAAIGGGLGVFVTYIGLKNAGFINFVIDGNNLITVNDKAYNGGSVHGPLTSLLASGGVTPELTKFTQSPALLALIGLLLLTFMLIKKVPGAFLITLVATTLIGIPMGVTDVHMSAATSLPHAFSEFSSTFGAAFGPHGMQSLFGTWQKTILAVVTIFAMGLTGLFDAIGTLIGIGNQTGIFSKEDQEAFVADNSFNSKMDKALVVDTFTTTLAGAVGTSNTTTFIESATGVAAGGRTGLANVVTSVGFLLMLFLAPLVSIVPTAAIAPLLIVVGIMMMAEFKKIDWADLAVALPAFFTSIFMAFSYSISYGIAAGFIFYIVVKIAQKQFKTLSPILLVITAFFLINFILIAII
ncbi:MULTISPECIES: NCS2 family permease [Fructobacillus]|uniref:Nucleobase:cation symporter 2 ( NCS2) family (NCS2) n=1 Tax=Fructobacillus tropaeoli TaxID=709323 RepID=A0A3F3GY32_9LACO|nr:MULTISPECIES: NCS2 family permease [Fructobacillus]CAK1227871.1 Xanthine/guanine/uracil/vitamin C permease GhxP/GhxQ [Fructobacillus cardui]KMK53135.1 putative adenine permease PurP [Fructobacillus sp. EFB-N1]NLS37645.1 NCS2 family permease [Fructobacillus tropaeoli]CAK1224738.1 Xanthine/guanine/uracil/vitamin C permease GhxP/GhxQ [Fructobacillus tropaeoli]CAK1234467.1 Xanthine/guanine/uracil/vitamin C permease GhxP/GhxQ [Fructobacillus tropaeoli]